MSGNFSGQVQKSQKMTPRKFKNVGIRGCCWLYVGDNFWMLVTHFRYWRHLLDFLNLSPIYFVSDIRHQNWCSRVLHNFETLNFPQSLEHVFFFQFSLANFLTFVYSLNKKITSTSECYDNFTHNQQTRMKKNSDF